MNYQKLYNYLNQEFGIIPLEQDMQEIEHIVKDSQCLDRLQMLINRIQAFSNKNFPNSTIKSKLLHMKEEIDELIAKPGDTHEWADVAILFLNAFGTIDGTSEMLLNIIDMKMNINDKRTWGKPDKDGIVRHIKA